MQYNLAKSTVIAVMKKTDQEIIVSRKHKSGLEIEVLRLYVSGVEMQGFEHYGCMTTKNAVEIWGGVVRILLMTTKNAHGDVQNEFV